jgi:hypothetical protein
MIKGVTKRVAVAQTAQPIPAKNGPTEWAYSSTVKPP